MRQFVGETVVKPNAWVQPPIDLEHRIPMEGAGLTGEEELDIIRQVVREGVLTWGRYVYEFEEAFTKYFKVKHAYSVSSCTAALAIAVKLLGIQPGDEVIVPGLTFIATSLPALDRGAQIRFADVEPDTLNVSAQTIERILTKNVKAIFIVHHDGNPVDMDPILELAKAHAIPVVEDCAHAPGAQYKGRYAGTMADIGCYSFHARKNITTVGEGGMVATNRDEFQGWIGSLRTFGHHSYEKPIANPLTGEDMPADHALVNGMVPMNYPLSDVQCAVGLVQLQKLDAINKRRNEIQEYYNEELGRIGGMTTPSVAPGSYSTCHRYTALFREQDWQDRWPKVKRAFEEAGIATQHTYLPNYLYDVCQKLGCSEVRCPNAESVYRRSFMLPIFPELTDAHIGRVIDTLRKAIG